MISPLLSNLYLNEVDRMLEKAIASPATDNTPCSICAFRRRHGAMIDSIRDRTGWLRRLQTSREELVKLKVEINKEKSGW